jgi:hypothetical protein
MTQSLLIMSFRSFIQIKSPKLYRAPNRGHCYITSDADHVVASALREIHLAACTRHTLHHTCDGA